VLPDVFQFQHRQRLVQKVNGTQPHGSHNIVCHSALGHQHNWNLIERVDEGSTGNFVRSD